MKLSLITIKQAQILALDLTSTKIQQMDVTPIHIYNSITNGNLKINRNTMEKIRTNLLIMNWHLIIKERKPSDAHGNWKSRYCTN